MESGIKYDGEKPRFDLIPVHAEEAVAKVLTFGAKKYDDENWKKVDNDKKRYIAAARRHISAWMKGQVYDSESGLHHLAHAVTCLMFILEKEEEDAS